MFCMSSGCLVFPVFPVFPLFPLFPLFLFLSLFLSFPCFSCFTIFTSCTNARRHGIVLFVVAAVSLKGIYYIITGLWAFQLFAFIDFLCTYIIFYIHEYILICHLVLYIIYVFFIVSFTIKSIMYFVLLMLSSGFLFVLFLVLLNILQCINTWIIFVLCWFISFFIRNCIKQSNF